MRIKNGDVVKLNKEIVDREFDYQLAAGTEGEVSGIIELPDQVLIMFHPDGDNRIYAIDVRSVTK